MNFSDCVAASIVFFIPAFFLHRWNQAHPASIPSGTGFFEDDIHIMPPLWPDKVRMRTALHTKRIQAAVMDNAHILAERSFILAVQPEKRKNIGRWLLIHFASPIGFFYTIPKIQRRIYYNVLFFITDFGSWCPCVQRDAVLCCRRILARSLPGGNRVFSVFVKPGEPQRRSPFQGPMNG